MSPDELVTLMAQTIESVVEPLAARIAALEAVPPVPGPPGPPGPPGLTYQGVYQAGKAYAVGDCVTWAGSLWHCKVATDGKPGEGLAGWDLMVKRGKDGRGA